MNWWIIIIASSIVLFFDFVLTDKKFVQKLSQYFTGAKKAKLIINGLKLGLLIFVLWATSYFNWKDGQRSERIENATTEIKILTHSIYGLDSTNKRLIDSIQNLAININKLDSINLVVANSLHQITKEKFEENTLTGQFNFDFIYDTILPNNIATPSVFLKLGSFQFSYYTRNINSYIPVFYSNIHDTLPIQIEIINDRLFVSLKVYDLARNIIVEVKRNCWIRNPNYCPRFNYDNEGFEFFDNKGNIALSFNLRYNNHFFWAGDRFVEIKGYIFTQDFKRILILNDESTILLDITKATKEKDISDEIKKHTTTQLFKYFGKNWSHKRIM